MGNKVVTSASPSQTYAIEIFQRDLATEYKYTGSLRSTRFFKVVKVLHTAHGKDLNWEYPAIVKIFLKSEGRAGDENDLTHIHDELYRIGLRLNGLPHVVPYYQAREKSDVAYLVRPYFGTNLYDRLSTRPFPTKAEQIWITYQLLKAMEQIHDVGVCHGDLKAENIVLSSSGWLSIVDFASFKPTLLPAENQGEFYFFFDSAGRGNCYIAPERFVAAAKADSDAPFEPGMDMFSVGCVIAEIFSRGSFAFGLSDLLSYANGDISDSVFTTRIEEPVIARLVQGLVARDPVKRLTATQALQQFRDIVFPGVMDDFLYDYLMDLNTNANVADAKIAVIYADYEKILQEINAKPTPLLRMSKATSSITGNLGILNEPWSRSEVKLETKSDADIKGPQRQVNDLVILILDQVTSCLRQCYYTSSKIAAVHLLVGFGAICSADVILDRIIPYIVFMMDDVKSRVRVEALIGLKCLTSTVTSVNQGNRSIFPEYIFPVVFQLARDPSKYVRLAYARRVGFIALEAKRFLEQAKPDPTGPQTSSIDIMDAFSLPYDSELRTLREMMQESVVQLLTNDEIGVRLAVINTALHELCLFFETRRSNDVILAHLITYVNDPDWVLRMAFWNCIKDVAIYIGGTAIEQYVGPLIEKGLTDPEEFVIDSGLRSLQSLCEMPLFSVAMLKSIVRTVSPLLCHPNKWIRKGAVRLIVTVCRNPDISIVDVHCTILPCFRSFLVASLYEISDEEILLHTLCPPIPRFLIEMPFMMENPHDFFRYLEDRIDANGDHQGKSYIMEALEHAKLKSQGDSAAQLKVKLRYCEPSSYNDVCLLAMKNYFMLSLMPGQINRYRQSDLIAESSGASPLRALNQKSKELEYPTVTIDLEEAIAQAGMNPAETGFAEQMICRGMLWPSRDVHQVLVKEGMQTTTSSDPARDAMQGDHGELQVHGSAQQYDLTMRRTRAKVSSSMKGKLISHLHEHTGGINHLVVNPHDNSYFLTGSNDGTVKLWDVRMIEKRTSGRSRTTYDGLKSGRVTHVAVIEHGSQFVGSNNNGKMHVVDVLTNSKMGKIDYFVASGSQYQRTLNPSGENCISDLCSGEALSRSLVLYSNMEGDIHGWDCRSGKRTFTLGHRDHRGLIKSFCLDSSGNWLVSTTPDGYLTLWDVRFNIPLRVWQVMARQSRSHGVSALSPGGIGDGNSAGLTSVPLPMRQVVPHVSANLRRHVVLVPQLSRDVLIWDVERMEPSHVLRSTPPPSPSQVESIASVNKAFMSDQNGLLGNLTYSAQEIISRHESPFLADHAHGVSQQGHGGALGSNSRMDLADIDPWAQATDRQKHESVAVAFSYPDRPMILTGGHDSHIRLWRLENPDTSTVLSTPHIRASGTRSSHYGGSGGGARDHRSGEHHREGGRDRSSASIAMDGTGTGNDSTRGDGGTGAGNISSQSVTSAAVGVGGSDGHRSGASGSTSSNQLRRQRHAMPIAYSYRHQNLERGGGMVITESWTPGVLLHDVGKAHRYDLKQTNVAHADAITAIATATGQQSMLALSGSRDGAVKVWV
eukprot:Clim_evm45s156 gene=Clim_evmTU45s156